MQLPYLVVLPVQVPGARLALVGDGPQRQELEQHLKGMPVKFMVSHVAELPVGCVMVSSAVGIARQTVPLLWD